MSKNRPDWFNPNNPAYRIRQQQIGKTLTHSFSSISSNDLYCNAPISTKIIKTTTTELSPAKIKDSLSEVKDYLTVSEEGKIQITSLLIAELFNFQKEAEERKKELFGVSENNQEEDTPNWEELEKLFRL